jgi:hypothetical protein
MREFESCQSSQPVPVSALPAPDLTEKPANWALLAGANSLHVPKFSKRPVTSREVSTGSLNNSRFLESLVGDYFECRETISIIERVSEWQLNALTRGRREGPS